MSATTSTVSSTTSFGVVKQIAAGLLDVGYVEEGPADGPAAVLLHGWPYDIHSYVDVVPLLTTAGYRVIVPYLRGFGSTRFRSDETFRNGEQAALALDTIALLDALGIERAVVAGFDWGARTADIVAALWPERCSGLVSVSGYLIGSQEAGRLPLPPEAELQWWYQYYFATERGQAGYEKYRRDFAKLIWRTASPQVGLRRRHLRAQRSVLRQSRPRRDRDPQLPLAARARRRRSRVRRARAAARRGAGDHGARRSRSKATPTARRIRRPEAYAGKFSGRYTHRTIEGGIGHNLPQEAPQAFADAVLEVGAGSLSLFSSVRGSGSLPVEGHLPGFGGATGWLNSPPLTDADVQGKVVLADFWTYTCINWLRTLAYVRAWAERYADQGLVVVGVHTPEFPFERDIDNVRRAVEDMRVGYPVALDSDYAIWQAFANHYWPAVYIADAEGRIRHHQFGEGGYAECEMVIQRLLREAGREGVGDDLVSVAPDGFEAQADWDEPGVARDVSRLPARSELRVSRRR